MITCHLIKNSNLCFDTFPNIFKMLVTYIFTILSTLPCLWIVAQYVKECVWPCFEILGSVDIGVVEYITFTTGNEIK